MTTALDTHTGLPVQTVEAACVRLDRATARQRERCAALRSEVALLAAVPASDRTARLRTPASTPRAEGPPQTPSLARRLRVLLVEDDEQLARLTASKLEHNGFDVDAVLNGADACARFRRGYDVVVADLDLGAGCTGVSVLREAALRLPDAKRVAWSGALVGDELEAAARASSAHVAVAKARGRAPVADLIAAIRGLEVG